MGDGSQTGKDLRGFGTWELPRIVGVLTLLGYAQADATTYARRGLMASVGGGMEGGTGAAASIESMLLIDAKAPKEPRPPDGPLEAALAELPWDERKATVITFVPGITRLGAGRPDQIATAVGARLPGWAAPADPTLPSLAEVIAEAVAARACAPEPDLVDEALASAGRRRLRVLAIVLALVAVVVVAGLLLANAVRQSAATPTGRAGAVGADASDAGATITQWVAVLRAGPDAATLADEARRLGRDVGVYVFTDRWSCYTGFPDSSLLDPEGWFLGLAANDKAVVDGLLASVDRTPMVEALVQQVCVQPPPDGGGPILVTP